MDVIKGPTPHGGEYAHVFFLDNDNKSSDKEHGTHGYIVEFDKNNKRICETTFIIKGKFVPKIEKDKEKTIENIEVLDI